MQTLLHVVHPYTFKLEEENVLTLGSIPQFQERDELIGRFLREALDARVRVLCYNDRPFNTLMGAFIKVTFEQDPNYKHLLDPSVDVVVTTHYGTPIMTKKPDKLTAEQWRDICNTYTSHSTLQTKIGEASIHIFFGGLIEACVANTLGYHLQHFHKSGTRVCYVPEFCVSFSTKRREKCQQRFEELGIATLSSQDAFNILHGISIP